MSTRKWENLESAIKEPKNVKPDEYRDTLETVFTTDEKLHFFGLKGVDPTNDNWHETICLGTYKLTYDLKAKKWLDPIENVPPLDKGRTHREHLFAVGDQIFLFVYSIYGACFKLYQWKNNGWSKDEVKFESACKDKPCCSTVHKHDLWFRFYDTKDGFLVTFETDKHVYVSKMTVDVQNNQVKSARCDCIAKWDMHKFFAMNGHVTLLAHTIDNKKLFIWGGQQGCGFRWEPSRIFSATLELNKIVEIEPEKQAVEGPSPPYAFSGPRATVQLDHSLLMMGGSTQVGLSQTQDNKQIWAFDTNKIQFSQIAGAKMPDNTPLYRFSHGIDYSKFDVYACDKETGIFKLNVKNLV